MALTTPGGKLMKSILAIVMAGAFLFPATGSAQVEVQRRGEENPVLTVSKSIVYGGLAGLVLGGALALVGVAAVFPR
jgi:hypothetical protein